MVRIGRTWSKFGLSFGKEVQKGLNWSTKVLFFYTSGIFNVLSWVRVWNIYPCRLGKLKEVKLWKRVWFYLIYGPIWVWFFLKMRSDLGLIQVEHFRPLAYSNLTARWTLKTFVLFKLQSTQGLPSGKSQKLKFHYFF